MPGRTLAEIRFYTGVPDPAVGSSQLFWHGFWSNKIRYLRSQGVYVYRGRVNAGGQEKGVDVSLALDLVRATYERQYEAAVIVSQDWDFGPAVRLAKEIARAQDRRLVFESCFPLGPGSHSRRGVPGTTWVPIDQSDLRQLSRSEGLPSEEAVDGLASAVEGCGPSTSQR